MKSYMKAMADSIVGTGPLDVEAFENTGFDPKFVRVYSNNSASALRGALLSNYPSVTTLIGDEYASALARIYRETDRTTRRTLVGYGERFPELIGAHLDKHNLPYLQSFARLDRAWTQAHIAPDSATLVMQDLANIVGAGADLESQTLSLKPDVKLVDLDWPVLGIWSKLRQNEAISEAMELNQNPEQALVWRYQNEVISRSLSAGEFAFITAILQDKPLGEALNLAIVALPDGDVTTLLPKMVEAEIFQPLTGDTDA
ncbi:MAG: hypothetical protein COA69_12015 [Robiginitomaculum sp.]|nr:MAG: hypothetical protein COA69_12015 [Robiginitomaculum sp.]